MSVVSVQAGLARYVLESDPATSASALETIADTSARALEEMRLLLALLRVAPHRPTDDASAADFMPGLDRLDELTERVSTAGVPVTLVVNGTAQGLTSGVELCAYRIVQESLTNVLKHAGPAHATVTLTYETDRLEVTVVDDGRGNGQKSGHDSGGHGLIGMRERAKLYGGTLVAAAKPAGGFEVVLTVPVSPASIEEPPRLSRDG
jgi:signal transduction histidine kinase